MSCYLRSRADKCLITNLTNFYNVICYKTMTSLNKLKCRLTFTNTTFTGNKYTFNLTNDGTAEIAGIPQGITYTVTEADYSAYYTTTSTGATTK